MAFNPLPGYYSWQLVIQGGRQLFSLNHIAGNTTHPELIHSTSSGEDNALHRSQSPVSHLDNGDGGGWIPTHWCLTVAHWLLDESQTTLPRRSADEANPECHPYQMYLRSRQSNCGSCFEREPKSLGHPLRYDHDVPLHSLAEATCLTASGLIPCWYFALIPEVKILANGHVYSCECVHECVGRKRWMTKPLAKVIDFDIFGLVWLVCKLKHSRF